MVSLGLPLVNKHQDSLEYINRTIEHRARKWHANADGLSRRGLVAKDYHDCPAYSGGMKLVALQTETNEGEECNVTQTKLWTQINLLQDWQAHEDGWPVIIQRLETDLQPPMGDKIYLWSRETQLLVKNLDQLSVRS